MRTSESSWSSNAPQPPGLPAPRARAAAPARRAGPGPPARAAGPGRRRGVVGPAAARLGEFCLV